MRADPGEIATSVTRILELVAELQRLQTEWLRALELEIRRIESRERESAA